jgi:hypothetical protein
MFVVMWWSTPKRGTVPAQHVTALVSVPRLSCTGDPPAPPQLPGVFPRLEVVLAGTPGTGVHFIRCKAAVCLTPQKNP